VPIAARSIHKENVCTLYMNSGRPSERAAVMGG
jgi:hypothetical protein